MPQCPKLGISWGFQLKSRGDSEVNKGDHVRRQSHLNYVSKTICSTVNTWVMCTTTSTRAFLLAEHPKINSSLFFNQHCINHYYKIGQKRKNILNQSSTEILKEKKITNLFLGSSSLLPRFIFDLRCYVHKDKGAKLLGLPIHLIHDILWFLPSMTTQQLSSFLNYRRSTTTLHRLVLINQHFINQSCRLLSI